MIFVPIRNAGNADMADVGNDAAPLCRLDRSGWMAGIAETGPGVARTPAMLDPEIAAFIDAMGQGWSRHPPLDTLPVTEARKVAEAVRAPWARGGPEMADTRELRVPVGGGDVRIRILDPGPAGTVKPALAYLHGGGWTIFSIDTHDRLMREYAGRAGICVVGIDYSLSPEARFPRALDETVAVVRWLRDHGEAIGIDPRRILTGGDSAGANLALSAAIALRDAGEGDAVAGMVLNYGAFDNDCDNGSYRLYGGPGYMLGGQEMDDFWRNYLGDRHDGKHPLAVPLHASLEALPPAFLCVPDCDVLYDENVEMARRLRAAGVDTTMNVYAGASHSFLEAVSVAAVAERAHADTAAWIRAVLG